MFQFQTLVALHPLQDRDQRLHQSNMYWFSICGSFFSRKTAIVNDLDLFLKSRSTGIGNAYVASLRYIVRKVDHWTYQRVVLLDPICDVRSRSGFDDRFAGYDSLPFSSLETLKTSPELLSTCPLVYRMLEEHEFITVLSVHGRCYVRFFCTWFLSLRGDERTNDMWARLDAAPQRKTDSLFTERSLSAPDMLRGRVWNSRAIFWLPPPVDHQIVGCSSKKPLVMFLNHSSSIAKCEGGK